MLPMRISVSVTPAARAGIDANNNAVRMKKIRDGGPFAKKFGIGGDAEFYIAFLGIGGKGAAEFEASSRRHRALPGICTWRRSFLASQGTLRPRPNSQNEKSNRKEILPKTNPVCAHGPSDRPKSFSTQA